ncbi:MAG: tetratricopeptide repeat protein [Candidatus Azobacteroides sp.]|nr:tetratricopeptide repeat protein [Candidatus Azobacteroides sp.]
MKKIFLSAILCLAMGTAFAQKDNLKEVKKALDAVTPDYEAVQSKISSMLTNPETANDPEAWFVAGSFEDKIFSTENNKTLLQQTPDEPLMYKALFKSYDYFVKAIELEKIPNEKGKVNNKYTKQIKAILKINQPYFVNAGAYYYDNGDYGTAYEAFKLFLDIQNLDIFKSEALMADSVYNQIKLYAALSSSYNEDIPAAVVLLEDLKTKDYETEQVYTALAQNYQIMGDSVKYAATLKEGVSKLPDSRFFLESMINMYINSGQIDEAMKYLDDAIAKNPTVPEYWRVKGDLYETEIKDVDKALEAFEQSLNIDPTYARGIAGIGRLYYNQGFNLQQKANELSFKEAQVVQEEVNEYYKKALPYLEKAHQLDPDDRQYIMALYAVYYALKMPEVEEMEKLLNGE